MGAASGDSAISKKDSQKGLQRDGKADSTVAHGCDPDRACAKV